MPSIIKKTVQVYSLTHDLHFCTDALPGRDSEQFVYTGYG